MIAEASAYFSLFLAALVAATLVPAQSEAVLIGLAATGRFSIPLLLLIAAIGNVLGSFINWLIGRQIERFRERSWFPVSEKSAAARPGTLCPLRSLDLALELTGKRYFGRRACEVRKNMKMMLCPVKFSREPA